MRLNNQGFTLIEVIGVVVIIGIITMILVPIGYNYLISSQNSSEKIFITKITDIVDSYVELNNIEYDYDNYKQLKTCDENTGVCTNRNIYKSNITLTFNDIISYGLISGNEFVNPKNKEYCSTDSKITVYIDDNNVTCFNTYLDCIDKNINTCSFDWNDLE